MEKKEYFIHDNGGRPFKVIIKRNKTFNKHVVLVQKQEKDEEYVSLIKYIEPQKIFIGKSKKSEISDACGSEWDGNSILLHINDNNYVYIGADIKFFQPWATIEQYESPIGNSDVPYPWAKDIDDNIYLFFTDDIIVLLPTKKRIEYLSTKNSHDPSIYYFSNNNLRYFENIYGLEIGNKIYSFTHNGKPEIEWKYWLSTFDQVDTLGIKVVYYPTTTTKSKKDKNVKEYPRKLLTIKTYTSLQKRFGAKMGFDSLQYIPIVTRFD